MTAKLTSRHTSQSLDTGVRLDDLVSKRGEDRFHHQSLVGVVVNDQDGDRHLL
jgi:hypothetical protein